MKNQLSHSAVSKYQSCPTAYKLHYIDRLRPKFSKSALLFGSAFDKGLMCLLAEGADSVNPELVFEKTWALAEINKVMVSVASCPDVVYANSDYDYELLTEADIADMKTKFGVADPIAFIDTLFDLKAEKSFAKLEPEQRSQLNYANWLCLRQKGFLMLQAARIKILPKITFVKAVQQEVKLENSEGDTIIGYADIICNWEGYEDPIIFDAKTSTIDYKEDSVLTSPQLSLYVHGLFKQFKTRLAGFWVFYKQVKKNKTKVCSVCGFDGTGASHRTCPNEATGERCKGAWIIKLNPEVYVDIIIDAIPAQTESIVLDNYDYINQALKTDVYPRNFNSCIMPWGKCEYYNLCYKNDSSDLIKVESSKK